MDSEWNLDLFASFNITTDYNHMEQFQLPAPTIHWQMNFNSSEANWTNFSSWSLKWLG
jgi:hypothetical protein